MADSVRMGRCVTLMCRGGTLTAMLVGGLVLFTPGAQGAAPHSKPKPTTEKTGKTATASPGPASFNLANLPADATGIVSVRPAAIFRKPGMAKYAHLLNQTLTQTWSAFGLKGRPPLKIEDIEQVIGAIAFRYPANPPPGQHGSMMMTPSMVRTVRDFDWLAALRGIGLDFSEVREGGRTYYRVSDKQMAMLGTLMGLRKGDLRAYFFLPDRRSIVVGPGPNGIKLAAGPYGT